MDIEPYLAWIGREETVEQPVNLFQAHAIGCHIITVTNDVLAKLNLVGKDLDQYSLETVEMFRRDAVACGFTIAGDAAATPLRAAS